MAGVDYAHQRDIVDQFTRQAEVFADKHRSMHHFLHPAAVLAEMKRACAPGGKAVVIDATLVPAKAKDTTPSRSCATHRTRVPCRWKNCPA